MSAEAPKTRADDEFDVSADDLLAKFVLRLSIWHSDKVANLRAIQKMVREGTTLKLGSGESTGHVMTGRDVGMFKTGIEAALADLGTLPFTVSKVDDEDDQS